MSKRERKPFSRTGWILRYKATGEPVYFNGRYLVAVDRDDLACGDMAEPVRVEVREVLPKCRHECAEDRQLPWCRECGAWREIGLSPNTGWHEWSRWRKPRRA